MLTMPYEVHVHVSGHDLVVIDYTAALDAWRCQDACHGKDEVISNEYLVSITRYPVTDTLELAETWMGLRAFLTLPYVAGRVEPVAPSQPLHFFCAPF